MTAIAVAPSSAGTITLTISGAPAGPVTITRTDANGVGTVRLLAGQAPIAGAMVVTDYEAALVGVVTYQVVDSAAATTTSAPTTLAGLVTEAMLGVPVLPQLSVAGVFPLDTYSATRRSTGTIHEVIGRQDPVVTLGRAQLRVGSLQYLTEDYPGAAAIVQAYDRGEVVLLRQTDHAGLDLYHVATSSTVSPAATTREGMRWAVAVEFVEVAPPSGPRLGDVGWTWADLSATYSSWAAMRSAYVAQGDKWVDVTVGPA